MTNAFKQLVELEKEANIKSFVDNAWNKTRDIGSAMGYAAKGIGQMAYKTVAPVVQGGVEMARAVPRASWSLLPGIVGGVSKGINESDGTLGGAMQGAFDNAWNSGASTVKNLGSDLSGGVNTFGRIQNNFAKPPKPAAPAPTPSPSNQLAGPPAPPKQPGSPTQVSAPAPMGNPTNPFEAAKQQYRSQMMPQVKYAAAGESLFRDTRSIRAQFPNVASHSTADRAKVQSLLPPAPVSTEPILPPGSAAVAGNVAAPVATPPAAAPGEFTPDQLAMFRRGTASQYDPNSKMDQFKMKQLVSGDAQWASNPLYRASLNKAARVKDLMAATPRDVYLSFLAEAFA